MWYPVCTSYHNRVDGVNTISFQPYLTIPKTPKSQPKSYPVTLSRPFYIEPVLENGTTLEPTNQNNVTSTFSYSTMDFWKIIITLGDMYSIAPAIFAPNTKSGRPSFRLEPNRQKYDTSCIVHTIFKSIPL